MNNLYYYLPFLMDAIDYLHSILNKQLAVMCTRPYAYFVSG